ncbi:MAG: class I SAM-dependent methyltransferase [Fibrobacter sp.]|nr:class I SAM-dependent methyltransferase [Fibrobacter sp.]
MISRKERSREIGLDIGILFARHFIGSDHLHFGYWTEDMELKLENLHKAQEKHSDFLISQIPQNVKKILDVGAGAGALAKLLREKGYEVECVSPSRNLARYIKLANGENFPVHLGKFENVTINDKYDLVLFSESFQYVNLEVALSKSHSLLNEGGHLLICDFFKTDAPGKSPLGGGHNLTAFYDAVKKHPFSIVTEHDITANTAPNMDLVNQLLTGFIAPVYRMAMEYLRDYYKLVYRLIRYIFRKRLEKLDSKYFNGERNSKNFVKYKNYRSVLLKNL